MPGPVAVSGGVSLLARSLSLSNFSADVRTQYRGGSAGSTGSSAAVSLCACDAVADALDIADSQL